ncbi:MAG: hypothetical protein ABFR97_04820 [Thermodesulfobacteriota bacterium]
MARLGAPVIFALANSQQIGYLETLTIPLVQDRLPVEQPWQRH